MSTAKAHRAGWHRESGRTGPTVWLWALVLSLLAVLGFLVAWLGGWIRFTTDPRVQEILSMQEEARSKYAAAGGPTTLIEATAAMTAMTAIRQKVDALPEHLRPQVERAGGGIMRDVFRARIEAYFDAPPEKRQAELDRQIDQELIMEKAFQASRAVMNAVGGGGARGDAGGAPGGGGPPRGPGQDDPNRWRKNMIDRTSPKQRARYAEYRRAMEERRQQRGLTTGPPGGPR